MEVNAVMGLQRFHQVRKLYCNFCNKWKKRVWFSMCADIYVAEAEKQI